MTDAARIERFLENWQNEVDSAAQYRFLAETETDTNLSRIFRSLAETEEKHAAFWEQKLHELGVETGSRRVSWRGKVLISVGKYFDRHTMVSSIAAGERVARNDYALQPETAGSKMQTQEGWHSRVLQEILNTQQKGLKGTFLARMEGRHRATGGNALRAAVLGANDGLCSNLSLVMGLAGASIQSSQLLLTGFAGLLAGAFSMALGEYVSVTSARELAEREIRIEADELDVDLKSETKELQLIYEAKGLSESEARTLSEQLMKDPTKALETLAREELGIDPEDLGGSAWEAAIMSFLLFGIGALIPVLPFVFLSGTGAVATSIFLSATALFMVGALITIFTGRSVWYSGFRQLALGLVAAATTYFIGKWVGGIL